MSVLSQFSGIIAAAVTNTPAGNIAASTVQAALNELDAEKALLGGSSAQNFATNTLTASGATSITTLTASGGVNLARGSIVQHATTMNLWALSNTLDGTGSALTITAIANAPQAGPMRRFYGIAGTVWTNNAMFAVDGGTFTFVAGDYVDVETVTTATYKVHPFKADGTAVVAPSSMPVGAIIDFAGSTPPAGFLTCPIAQTNISRTTYAALFAVIGTLWGAGDGSTTFGMPWFPADYVAGQANANVGTQTVGDNLSHTHIQNAHSHTAAVFGASVGSAGSIQNQTAPTSVTTSSTTAVNQTSGGSANLAAGARVLKCVKF